MKAKRLVRSAILAASASTPEKICTLSERVELCPVMILLLSIRLMYIRIRAVAQDIIMRSLDTICVLRGYREPYYLSVLSILMTGIRHVSERENVMTRR